MRYVQLSEAAPRTFALVFEEGDEVLRDLKAFLLAEQLGTGHFTAIGAFERATLAYFDWERKAYDPIPVDEQVEAVSVTGNVAQSNGEPAVHCHGIVSHRDGHTTGGHLLEAHVRPTLELFLTETPIHLQRTHRPAINLSLIDVTKTKLNP